MIREYRQRVRPSRFVLGMAATAMVVTGWTSTGTIAAAATDPSGAPADGGEQLTSLADVAELADASAGRDGVQLAVLADHNGAAPGGIEVSTVRAEPGGARELAEQLDGVPGVLTTELDQRVASAEDPYRSQQYAVDLVRAEQGRGTAGVTGAGVLVAIVDSGVAGSHADLSPALPGGAARVLHGTTFLTPDRGQPDLTGSPGDVDPNGHGTHVAGIVAAAAGNGLGIEGVAPDAQLLPVRVLDPSGFGWSSDVAKGILWAHQQGADVINLSLAGPSSSASVNAAIEHVATDTSRGKPPTIVVAAAGNSGRSYAQMWPAAHARVIAVGSSDGVDGVAVTSSRGSYVDVAAPGVGILSTCGATGYCVRSGTSMASPLVAGAAALLRQQNPARSQWSVEHLLETTAYDIDVAGFDTTSGWGRVDLAAALASTTWPRVARPAGLPSGSYVSAGTSDRVILVGGSARDRDGSPVVRLDVLVDGRRSTRETTARNGSWAAGWTTTAGTHEICASVVDVPTRQPVSLGCRDVVVK